MAWNDRIRPAAYTAPSGARIAFDYEDVSRAVEKRTAAFNFPDADGTYVQDLGRTGRRYPLRVFFWGDDYDQTAEAFEAALLERGAGKLEHPIYGVKNVVPFGEIRQRDDLKTAANQAVFEVSFWETTDVTYPEPQADAGSAVLAAVGEYNATQSEAFANLVDLDTAGERASFENTYLATLGNVESALGGIADTQDDVGSQFNAISDSINRGIDVLISDPSTLASQTSLLLQTPAKSAADISARLSSYGSLINSLISGDGATAERGLDSKNTNRFQSNDLYAMGYVTGSVSSAVNNQFTTKPEALAAAEAILGQFDSVAAWRDANYQSLDGIDTGEAYQQLQEAVALCAGFLVQISFTLKQERRIVLDRSRTIIDLSAELYGTVDVDLDFLINTNNLSGSEILELPAGREIVYYV